MSAAAYQARMVSDLETCALAAAAWNEKRRPIDLQCVDQDEAERMLCLLGRHFPDVVAVASWSETSASVEPSTVAA